MTSIFTGLAFMHGHIVDRELVLRLGRDDTIVERGKGTREAEETARKNGDKASTQVPARPACAAC